MSDKLVWSNTLTQDFLTTLPEEDLRAELVDYGYEPEMLDGLDYEGLKQLVWDDDGMWQMDSEQFENEVRPMIEKQTCDGIVLMAGKAGTWQGNLGAGRAVYAEDLLGGNICNDCDHIGIFNVDGDLQWEGWHHDGIHEMRLYKLPDLETEEDLAVDFVTACMPYAIDDEMDFNEDITKEDAIFNVMLEIKQHGPDYINDFCIFSKVPEVCEPIRASVNEGLNEDAGDRVVTTKPFSADNVIEITDYYPSIEIINAGKGMYQLKGPKADIMDAIWEFLADDHKMSDFFDSVAGAKEGLEEGCMEDECAAKGEDPAEVAMEAEGELDESSLGDTTKIKDWVANHFPDEFQLDQIKPDMTFQELEDLMKNGGDVYEVASVDGNGFDSTVREEIFTGMSEVLDKPYDYFYNLWLYGDGELEEGCELEEAKSQNPEALSTELEELEADYNDFGPEGMYAVTFDSFEKNYPEFTNTCIKAFLKELEILEPEEADDPALLNEYWQTGELIQPADWPALFDGAHQLLTNRKEKGLQWGKIWKKYYKAPDEEEATDR